MVGGMPDAITRVTLFVPGGALLRAVNVDCPTDWIENDGHFGQAFSFGTVEPATVAKIDQALGALVMMWPVDLKTGRKQIVAAVKQLREAGALAVRIEESKLGWDIATWIEIFESDDPWAWHRGAVAFLGSDNALQSIGMHVFSLPDVRIPLEGDRRELQAFATVLDIYQLAEDPLLQSGQTFAPDAETPRRVVERWPAVEYPRDHPCHNPYGTWRVGPPGGKARPTRDPAAPRAPRGGRRASGGPAHAGAGRDDPRSSGVHLAPGRRRAEARARPWLCGSRSRARMAAVATRPLGGQLVSAHTQRR